MEDIIQRIQKLKKERDAVLLAHYYVNDSVQQIADYVGDSYYLSKKAAEAPQKTILFCGVKFMAESAKILNPEKTVIMADTTADCPMAHMVDEERIKQVRAQYDDVAVVCYINSTSEIKALCDVCVTSSNAEKIIRALPQKYIFFVPDQNLGRYIAKLFPEKTFIFNDGFCYVHTSITKENIERALAIHPQAKVIVHPECTMDVAEIADYVGSTSGIINYATKSDAETFIVGTEMGVLYQLKKANPNKTFYFVGNKQMCTNMKKITLEKIEQALLTMANPIEMDEDLRLAAENSLKRMHEIAK
ncbi:MAG: quinolinate synthase NadA [Clostridia bacterium]|jgi:quinolinate synthase|nr:quinolinate synthase NadA [Clostridia bacterium]MDD4571105.1 quinolinate synthase NadA [Clostridia bacterium]